VLEDLALARGPPKAGLKIRTDDTEKQMMPSNVKCVSNRPLVGRHDLYHPKPSLATS
jgi:hypothetical protein